MADKYIKHEDAKIILQRAWIEDPFRRQEAFDELNSIPSADVQPVVHGKWEDGDVDGIGACGIEYRYKKCSICDYEYSFPIKYNFCPNCGARMDGGYGIL